MKKLRVGIIFEHFGPYHVARIRAAGEFVDVVPIELFGKCRRYDWEELADDLVVERSILFEELDSSSVSSAQMESSLSSLLDSLNLDCLAVHGWSLPGAVAAIKWAKRKSVPTIVMSESKRDDAMRSWPKEIVKRSILGHVSAGLVGAESHHHYLVELGLSPESIFRGYNAIDNDYFARSTHSSRSQQQELRAELELPAQYFFASGRFIEKKNLERLLEAYALYRSQTSNPWHLVLAGDGPLGNSLRQQAERSGLHSFVHFPGFLQYDQLPHYYALASAFVHISTTEQWGLVVNEAAASRLPIIVSRSCGCAPHLVVPGENGLICDPERPESIAHTMKQISEMDSVQLKLMGVRSAELVQAYGPRQFGEGIAAAATYAMTHSRSGSLMDHFMLSLMK